MTAYADFLAAKERVAPAGPLLGDSDVHPLLHPWQRQLVAWSARTGRAALWADTGLGKTLMQLEWARIVRECNEWRSNYALPMDDERPRLPVVWTCVPCRYEAVNDGRDWDERRTPPDVDRVTAWCGSCSLTSWTYPGDEL